MDITNNNKQRFVYAFVRTSHIRGQTATVHPTTNRQPIQLIGIKNNITLFTINVIPRRDCIQIVEIRTTSYGYRNSNMETFSHTFLGFSKTVFQSQNWVSTKFWAKNEKNQPKCTFWLSAAVFLSFLSYFRPKKLKSQN